MRLSTVKEDTGIPLVRTKSPDSGKNFMYRKGRYVFYWAGGGVISKFFTNCEGSNLFYSQPGEGNSFFWQGKNYSTSLS